MAMGPPIALNSTRQVRLREQYRILVVALFF